MPLQQRRQFLATAASTGAGLFLGTPLLAAQPRKTPNVVMIVSDDQGYTDEEMKLQNESRKILDLPELEVTPTCVRVPVMVGHSIAVRAKFREEPDLRRALSALEDFPNLEVDLAPTPLEWAGRKLAGLP